MHWSLEVISFYLKVRIKHGSLRNIIYCLGGLGDDLCLTALAKAYYLKFGEKPNIFSSRPSLFKGNPYINAVLDPVDFGRWELLLSLYNKITYKNLNIRHLGYHHQPVLEFPERNYHKHMMEMMGSKINLTKNELVQYLERRISPILYDIVNTADPSAIPVGKFILIHSSSLSAPFPVRIKEWTMLDNENRFLTFCTNYGKTINERFGQLIHIGSTEDPALPNTVDLRGKTSLETLALLCKKAICFIGLEGGIMHMARAYGTPSIIIYGGRTMPEETGYIDKNIVNLYSEEPCSPCWGTNECSVEHRCMGTITESIVYRTMERLLSANLGEN